MEYAVSDFVELIEEFNIDPLNVDNVSAGWGDNFGGNWCGGFCLETEYGQYYLIIKELDGSTSMDSNFDKPYDPCHQTEEYEQNPTDIARWIREGCPEDVYSY